MQPRLLVQQAVDAGDADVVSRSTSLPISSAVTAASSATGRSDVPAHATSTVPVPGSISPLPQA